MTTTTFTTAGVNNLWSNAANWSAGVPANTDTAVIPVGQDCEYDADQSGFANGVTVQLAGTLHASTTAGSYVLKLAANMTGAGTLRAGTSGTPYPTNCTFEIQRNSFTITATSMTLDLNCSEPTVKYCKLTGTEAIGQTVWSVDTDLTSYTSHWVDGASVQICDINGRDTERRTVAAGGIAATTITVTAGLTAQKETGAYIVLLSRNVKITNPTTAGVAVTNGTSGRIFAEVFQFDTAGISGATNMTIGGTWSSSISSSIFFSGLVGSTFSAVCINSTQGIAQCISCIFTSDTIVAGCNNGTNGGVNNYFAGKLVGNTVAFGTGAGGYIVEGAFISGNDRGIDYGAGWNIKNSTFSGNTTADLYRVTSGTLYSTSLSSSVEFSGYNTSHLSVTSFIESINHDTTAGVYKAWTRGGIVTKTAAVFPTGYTSSQQHACESATYYCFQNYSVTVPSGGGLVVQCYVQKDALMSYLPRVWILLPGIEPFISGSPSYEAIMTADSISTWETLVLVYANSTSAPVTVTIRTVAKNATGNVYFYPINTVLAPATYDVYNTLQTDIDNIQTRLPAALVGGRMDSNIGAMAANTLTASALATDAVTEIQAAIFAGLMEGRTFEEIIKDIWAQTVGDFLADDGSDPTSITYDGPNGAVQITHTLTDTTRTVS